MEDLNLGTDAWDWHDDSFTLEYQASRGLPPSLWEEFPEENENSVPIFASTPVTDIMELDSVSRPELGDEDISKKTLSAKRRRMLMLCESEEACSSDSVWESDNFIYSQEIYGNHHTHVNEFEISTPPASQLPDTMKYINTVSNPSCIVRRNLELDRVNWEIICPDKRVQDNCWKQRNAETHLDDHSSGMWIQSEHIAEEKWSQNLADNKSNPGNKAAMSTTRPLSSVAYPFALVKPSEAEGNITIRHLNQRISKPQTLRGSKCNLNESNKSATSEQGFGLSGKSIVSLTKIHTEGKGTITIMRTRE